MKNKSEALRDIILEYILPILLLIEFIIILFSLYGLIWTELSNFYCKLLLTSILSLIITEITYKILDE